MLYNGFVFLHILSAILSIGPLFVIPSLTARLAKTDDAEEQLIIRIIKVIIRIVMHSGHALVVTGVVLLFIGPWPWHTSWVVATIGIMLLSAVFLARGFSAVLRHFGQSHVRKELLIGKLKRTTWMYISLLLLMLWLMVAKPILW